MKKAQLIASYAFSLAARAVLSPLKILPVKRDRALFLSYRGKQYSCNPRAISEELKRLSGDKIEIVWAFHAPEKFKYLEKDGVKVISDRGLRFIFTALTARAVCTNTYYKPYLPRRKKQFYLRTWHGGGAYKRVDPPRGLMGKYIALQQQGASLYLSSSKAFTRMTLRESFGYKGEVLEAGMPRNDPLVSGAWRKEGDKVRLELGLEGKKLCLYAPTYRDDGRAAGGFDAQKIKNALSDRFGGDWLLLGRGHHAGGGCGVNCDMDLSAYPDMQPLLMAIDALITDYSSSIWDMSLMEKPAFLFCPDLGRYKAERDFYTPITGWGYPVSEDESDLYESILSFDEAACHDNLKNYREALGDCESGEASRRAAERIMKECGSEP